jgi:hypothetical protein
MTIHESFKRSLKATASQRIEISRKEQQEQKNNKCQPYQKFVIVYWSLIRAEMLKGQYWPVIPDRFNRIRNPGECPQILECCYCPTCLCAIAGFFKALAKKNSDGVTGQSH